MTKSTQLQARQGVPKARVPRSRDIAEGGEAPLATIGQDLRNARLARGEDLASVSYALKIRMEHLDAIEEDRFDALPGRTYAVGFVRAYADYVGIDPIEAVERFKAEIAGRDHVSKTAGFPEEELEEPRLSKGWFLVAAIITALIAYGVYYLIASEAAQPARSVSAVPSAIGGEPNSKRSAKAVLSPNGPSASLLRKPEAVLSSTTPAAPAAAQVYGKMNANAHVVLQAKQATRILVQTEDGRAFINKELQPGDIYRVPNMRGLSLTAEHGNAVEISVDGKSVGAAGTSSAPAEALPLDREGLGKRAGVVSSRQ